MALNLAFADMKEETLIQKNLISERMAELLRKSRPQGHAMALDAVARYLDSREASGSPDEPESPYAAVERTVFRDIYEAVLNAYHRNGGDGAEAIRAGVTHGKAATAKAYAKDPDATRWGKSMDQYWETFYTVPRLENQTASEQQIEQMLAMIGRSSRRSKITETIGGNFYLLFKEPDTISKHKTRFFTPIIKYILTLSHNASNLF